MPQALVEKMSYRRLSSAHLRGHVLPILSLGALLAVALFGVPPAALAQEPSPISIQVEPGFGGKIRYGSWIPVAVQLENRGTDFAGELHAVGMRGGVYSSTRYIADVVLPKGSRKRLTLYLPSEPGLNGTRVELVLDRRVVGSLESPVDIVDGDDLFWGVVGERFGAWKLLTTLELPGQRLDVVMAPIAPNAFPQRPEALDAFDIIALGDVSVQALPERGLEALEGWVASGGILILPGGANQLANLKGLPETLMPVIPGEASELESTTALERLGGEPLPQTFPLWVNTAQVVSGHILADEGGVPLVVLSRFGQGGVLFLAFDPMAQPLVGWTGMAPLWKGLLFQSLPFSFFTDRAIDQGPVRYTGRIDQWREELYHATSNLPGIEFPSITLLLVLIAGYVLLVGPVNYAVLHRLRRRELAWATVPALVLIFSGVTYYMALETKGGDIQANSITIIHETSDMGWAKVRRMVGIQAPSEGDYLVELAGSGLVAPWDRGQSAFAAGGDGVRVRSEGGRSALELLNMGMWTVRSLWSEDVQQVDGPLSHDLYIDGTKLRGTVTNSSPMPLKQVWLIAGGEVDDLGAMEPGDVVSVDAAVVGSASGRSKWELTEDMVRSGPPPKDSSEVRWRADFQHVAMAALDSLHPEPSSALSILLLARTGEIPMGLTVNGRKPEGTARALFVKQLEPTFRGGVSLPGGTLLGRIVDLDGEISEAALGQIALREGSITFQFEIPATVRDIGRIALQVPFLSGSLAAQSVEAQAYHWEDETWEPLHLRPVSIRDETFAGRSSPQQVPLLQVGPEVALFRSAGYGFTFNEALEGEVGDREASARYVSATGLLRMKLHVGGGQVGTPSLVLEGMAVE